MSTYQILTEAVFIKGSAEGGWRGAGSRMRGEQSLTGKRGGHYEDTCFPVSLQMQ